MPATKIPVPASDAANDPIEAQEKTIAWILQQGGRAPELSAFAERQFTECQSLRVQHAKLQELVRKAQEEFAALCTPELHPVTIIHVDKRGELLVEVAGRGVGRLTVTVHPDVPFHKLRVGVCGLLTKQRNCLISVNGKPADYSAVGRFERHLGKHRALLEHRGEPVSVILADRLRRTELAKGDLIGFDAEVSNVAIVKLPKPGQDQLFETQIPTDDFQELGGLDSVIHRLKRVVSFRLLHQEVAQRYRLRRRGGVLLIGPPGNGKTRLARCLANYLSQLCPGEPARFMSIIASQDHSMWYGQSEKNLRDRFDAAREAARTAPVVMFFDEFDAIARRRGSDFGHTTSDRIENTLLALLDGVQQIDNLIVVAATNRADTLDPAIVRPGRLDQKILIGPPNRTAGRAILKSYLALERPVAENFERDKVIEAVLSRLYSPNGSLAELGHVKLADNRNLPIRGRELISGAILEGMVNQAAEDAADREILTGEIGLREDDLCRAIQEELRSLLTLLTPENVKSYLPSIPHESRPVAIETRRLTVT